MSPIIAVDVDQVVANLNKEVFRLYNAEWNDNLSEDNITTWDWVDHVKPECGDHIHDYLKLPDLYDNVQPVDKALWGVNYLRDLGFRVVFASSCFIGMEKYKLEWLVNHGFLKLLPNAYTCKDWIPIADKSLIRADAIIDDRPLYIKTFKGMAIVFDRPYNQDTLADARMKHWEEIPQIIENLFPNLFDDERSQVYYV